MNGDLHYEKMIWRLALSKIEWGPVARKNEPWAGHRDFRPALGKTYFIFLERRSLIEADKSAGCRYAALYKIVKRFYDIS